jgi:hypothetical protein
VASAVRQQKQQTADQVPVKRCSSNCNQLPQLLSLSLSLSVTLAALFAFAEWIDSPSNGGDSRFHQLTVDRARVYCDHDSVGHFVCGTLLRNSALIWLLLAHQSTFKDKRQFSSLHSL